MHADEIPTDVELVRRLVAAQFPQWAGLPVSPVAERGTDHALYRLGEDLVVRLPIIGWAVDQAESDRTWLPVLAPHLPVTVPAPLAVGVPGEGFPHPWSVVRWLPGRTPAVDGPGAVDLTVLAEDLGTFVRALRVVEASDGPLKTGLDRGVPLQARDELTRQAVSELGDRVDAGAVLRSWEESLDAEPWSEGPRWLHGDLLPGNLLVDPDGRLTAVIDWGALGVGDPAADVAPAWQVFDATSRPAYRSALDVDDATWLRGRGWALSTSLVALPYYWDSAPSIAAHSRRTVASVLRD